MLNGAVLGMRGELSAWGSSQISPISTSTLHLCCHLVVKLSNNYPELHSITIFIFPCFTLPVVELSPWTLSLLLFKRVQGNIKGVTSIQDFTPGNDNVRQHRLRIVSLHITKNIITFHTVAVHASLYFVSLKIKGLLELYYISLHFPTPYKPCCPNKTISID